MTTSSDEEEVSTISSIPMVSDELDSIEVEVSNRLNNLEEASRGSFNDLVMKAADSVEDIEKDSISIELPVMVELIHSKEVEKPSIGDQLKDFSDVINELDETTTIEPTEEASIISTEPSIEAFSTAILPMDEVTTIEPIDDSWLIVEMDHTTEPNVPEELIISSTVPSFNSIENEFGFGIPMEASGLPINEEPAITTNSPTTEVPSFHPIDDEFGSGSSISPIEAFESSINEEPAVTTNSPITEESIISNTVPIDDEFGSGSSISPMEASGLPLTEEPFVTTDSPTTELPSAEELGQAEPREGDDDEEESYPEFRYDDILINRIRTIVDSLTNPKVISKTFKFGAIN